MAFYRRLGLVACMSTVIGVSAVSAQSSRFTLQVEAMDRLAPAQDLVTQLKSSGLDAYYLESRVAGKGLVYRVRVGRYADPSAAQQSGEQLRRARVIRDYYVARYEDGTMPSAARPEARSVSTEAAASEMVRLAAPAYAEGAAQASAPAAAPAVNTGNGTVALEVPFERDDIGAGCFHIDTGSVVTGITSVGVFTAQDHAAPVVIPFPGLDSRLKFEAGVSQTWDAPEGITRAELFKLDLNRAKHQREFRVRESSPVASGISKGRRVVFPPLLSSGEYLILARTTNDREPCVLLPISVR